MTLSFWTDVGNEIAVAVKALGADVVKFATYLKPLVIADAKTLAITALSAVIAQAPLLITGQEKMTNAVASVKTTLAAAGQTAELSLIQAVVQDTHDQLSAAAHPTTAVN